MPLKRERVADGWTWWRIADPAWKNPLDPAFAAECGGRWNPPHSFPTLYLNEDHVTARLNLRAFIARWPYEPEDLRPEHAPVLVGARLPRAQDVCDVHTPAGVRGAGLPATYPRDSDGRIVPRAKCQPAGLRVKKLGLRGVRARCAQTPDGEGRDLAWFPATPRSTATPTTTLLFDSWYWS